MAMFKCKMCGGALEIVDETGVCTCDYCGTEQTLPKVTDENLQNLFNRANVLRMKAEFDKAAEIYDKILQNDGTEAEAYWGLILCKYGIEYVEDPKTYDRVPTCHRASYDAIVADDDYKMAMKYGNMSQRILYEKEANQIDAIQKNIVEIAQNEEPYDVFICYKETDENNRRTIDSTIANDIYYQLTQEGYKVFYAAITLEDKLGQEYEPYIFSALNSAKVMLAIGTKVEYFNAVWVKNEWSRFLKIMKKDRARMLIPCYKDMDAYELPEEFAHLQAQDMSKIGFVNDIVRGIKKVIVKEQEKQTVEQVVVQQTTVSANYMALLDRGNMALEDEEWEKAESFFEDVLNQNAKCAEAYLGKMLIEYKLHSIDEIIHLDIDYLKNKNLQRAIQFGSKEFVDKLENIKKEKENIILKTRQIETEKIYQNAQNFVKEKKYERAFNEFKKLGNYRDSKDKIEQIKKILVEIIAEAVIDRKRDNQIKSQVDEYDNKISIENEKIKELKKELDYLLQKKQTIQNDIGKLTDKKSATEQDIGLLINEKNTLGLFALKRKKEIDALVVEKKELIISLKEDIRKKNKLFEMYSKENKEAKITEKIELSNVTIKSIEMEKKEIQNQMSKTTTLTYEKAMKILNNLEIKKVFIDSYPQLKDIFTIPGE